MSTKMGLSLTVLSIKRILYLILITSTSFIIYFFHYDQSQSHWIIWSTLFLGMTVREREWVQNLKMVLWTGFALILVVGLSGLLSTITYLFAAFLAVLSFICILVSQKHYQYLSSAFVINIFAVIAGFPVPSLLQNIDRISYILISLSIVSLFQFIFYFGFIKNEFRFNVKISIRHLQLLSKEIFSCLIYPEYVNHIYLFERRIHVRKNLFLRSFNQLQKIHAYAEKTKHVEAKKINHLLKKLNLLYDILLDCSLLRFRITDYAIFKVCTLELIDLSKSIDNAFSQLMKLLNTSKQASLDITQLVQKVQKLEENYQNVLQVAANHPLAFFLFINSIKAFIAEIEDFSRTAYENKL